MSRRRKSRKISSEVFEGRRKDLMSLMEENSIAILPSASLHLRNSNVEHRFRQASNFHYLSGFDEPDAVLVLIPNRSRGQSILFCGERGDEYERWHGLRAGPEAVIELYGVDDAFPIGDIDDILPGMIEGRSRLYYPMGDEPDFDYRVIEWARMISKNCRRGSGPVVEFMQVGQYLHELRLFKSASEIDLMRRAANATCNGYLRILSYVSPGVMEYEVEAELYHEFAMNGARDSAYPAIVGGGGNACIMHYVDNSDELINGDLVLVDAGGEYENYACDMARTFPVNGRFSKIQRQIYEIVLKAQQRAIEQVLPGNTWNQPHEAAVLELTLGLIELGILEGDPEPLIDKKAYLPYFPHKTGHWLGLDVHDVGDYQVDGQWRVFEEGMVVAIEPGLYFNPELTGLPKRVRGIGIRIEDEVLVTRTGNEVLTRAVPKTIEGIESIMLGLER